MRVMKSLRALGLPLRPFGLPLRVLGSPLRAFALPLLLAMCFPVAAAASQKVSVIARFNPYKLGASTTLTLGFHVASTSGALPSPLIHVTALLPKGLGFAGSTLGVATCESAALLARGPGGCPPNALMGVGTAEFEVPFGPEILRETTYVTTVMAPSVGAHTNLLVYAEGRMPIAASVVFTGALREGDLGSQFGTLIESTVPLVPAAPGGPDVSIIRFQTTFGPAHLTYYRYVHGKRTGYHPVGMTVPGRCPRGGFPFAASFAFADGTEVSSKLKLPCPSTAKSAARGRAQRRARAEKLHDPR
jgi:hypothetical protein